jgi:hypothetical protein
MNGLMPLLKGWVFFSCSLPGENSISPLMQGPGCHLGSRDCVLIYWLNIPDSRTVRNRFCSLQIKTD